MDVSRPFSLSGDGSASTSEQSERESVSGLQSLHLGSAEVVSYQPSFRKHHKDHLRKDITLGRFSKVPLQYNPVYHRRYKVLFWVNLKMSFLSCSSFRSYYAWTWCRWGEECVWGIMLSTIVVSNTSLIYRVWIRMTLGFRIRVIIFLLKEIVLGSMKGVQKCWSTNVRAVTFVIGSQ